MAAKDAGVICYTTGIDVHETVGQVIKCLVAHGCKKVVTDYDDDGQPTALTFWIDTASGSTYFALPCNWQGVRRALDRMSIASKFKNDEQAQRVAWRILLVWVKAQMSIVESEIIKVDEAFFAHALTKEGTTVYQQLTNDRKLLKQ